MSAALASPARAAEPGIDFSCDPPTTASTPTLCLPGGLGEDEAAPLAAGAGPVLFAGLVVNDGPDVADASAVVTLPSALVSPGDDMVRRVELPIPVDGDDGDFLGKALPCERSNGDATITCRTGPLAHGDKILILVGVEVAPKAKIGTSATFDLALGPVAPDTYPTTTVHGTIDVVGSAHLRVSLAPDNLSALVGHSVTLGVRVRNVGNNVAADAVGFGLLFPRHERNLFKTHFRITNAPDLGGGVIFVGIGSVGALPATPAGQLRAGVAQSRHPEIEAQLRARARTMVSGARSGSGRSSSPSASPSAQPSARRSVGTPFALWPLGTIAPGATVKLDVRLAAVRPGTDQFLFTASSDTEDLACDGFGTGVCEEDAMATLHAIAAPIPPKSNPAGHGGRLTNTGAPVSVPALEVGLFALVVGSALTIAGRRRRV